MVSSKTGETQEARLFISQHLIKLVFDRHDASVGSSFDSDVLSFKYTIDFPYVEMHPLDTQRFKIFYDKCQESSLNAEYCLNKCLDLRCSSRVSRDLISLSLKCFSAQTYLMNSHIINSLPQVPNRDAVDLLLELNSVKKELSNSLLLAKQLTREKRSLEA